MRVQIRIAMIFLLLILFPMVLFAAAQEGEVGVEYSLGSGGESFSSGHFSDQDVRGFGRISLRNLYGGKISGYLDLEYLKDLDGFDVSDPFADLIDSYSLRDDMRVNYGYLDMNLENDFSIRVGRQRTLSAEDAYFDGLRFSGKYGKTRGFLFGGMRVSHYIEPDKDAIFGGKIVAVPVDGVRIYMADTKYVKNSLEFGMSLRLFSLGTFSGSFGVIETDPRFIRLTGTSRNIGGFTFAGMYERKLGNAADYEDFDFDFTSPDGRSLEKLNLGDLKPYAEYTLKVSRDLGEKGFLQVGFTRHKLVHDVDEDEYNRTFNRYFAVFNTGDLLSTGVFMFLKYEHLEEDRVTGDDASSGALTISLRKEIAPKITVGAGGFFSSYTHLFVGEGFVSPIDEDSKNYYAYLEYEAGIVRANIRAEVSDDDVTENYGSEWMKKIYAELTYRFF